MRKWLPMLILASAKFVMVLDSSAMNVAISQIVEDLDTTIQVCRPRSRSTRS